MDPSYGLAYILQKLGMPSVGKDKSTTPGHLVVAMVHLAAAVVQAVGTRATVGWSGMRHRGESGVSKLKKNKYQGGAVRKWP